ncbi:flagellar basal-body rod protein FlgG [Oceanobacillus limi]|uniref:Flagellar basal-body rod protein FlgG n=1 Tax=Oceanobacillus limi TaxID=930131 RepID=A0A1I0A175_9BACI|nr:flagellar hook-basal body protein [Oceanobacillus limi]SES87424.1 flagellar basal-body rod protein FlgG [Oceanobacillus limi]
MSRMMIQAATTMNQLQNKLDLIGHNLANSETTGYKNRTAQFSSLLVQQLNNMNDPANAEGRLTPEGIRVGSGAKLGAISNDLSLGSIKETGRSLDVALLEENHLFQVEVTENDVTETRYTRDGSFYLSPVENNQVMLTTKDGHPVLGPNGARIVFADGFDSISISENGEILAKRGDQMENVGELETVEAVRPRVLEATGDNNFRLPNLDELGYDLNDIIQLAAPSMKSGALETSNVDIGNQMNDMILTQRSYQFNARTISTTDQMMGLVNQLR